MELATVAQVLDAQPLSRKWDPKLNVEYGFAADLMSDVLSLARPGSILVTGLTHPQVIRTSEVAEVAAIVLARGKMPLAETSIMARETGLPILCTPMTVFEVCGRLYAAGIKPTNSSYRMNGEARMEGT